MRVALIQFAASLDPESNIEKIRDLMQPLVPEEVDLVVLPEAAMCDFGPPHFDVATVAEPLDGRFVQFLAEEAHRLNCYVIAGMFETNGDKPFNTLVALGPTGELRSTYRKIHLFDSFGYRESDRFTPGPLEPATINIGGRIWGLITCYDLRFPELTRRLSQAGAEGIVLPAAWLAGPNKTMQWDTLVRARAIENVWPVIAVGQHGPTYCGHSQVVGPLGEYLGQLENDEGVLRIELDSALTNDARVTNPALEHRRL